MDIHCFANGVENGTSFRETFRRRNWRRVFLSIWFCKILKQLSPSRSVKSCGYIPRRFTSRYISTTIFTFPSGDSCILARDSDPIRLFKTPRSVSVYVLMTDVCGMYFRSYILKNLSLCWNTEQGKGASAPSIFLHFLTFSLPGVKQIVKQIFYRSNWTTLVFQLEFQLINTPFTRKEIKTEHTKITWKPGCWRRINSLLSKKKHV